MLQNSTKGKFCLDMMGLKEKNNIVERFNKTDANDFPDEQTIKSIIAENYFRKDPDVIIYIFHEDSSATIVMLDDTGTQIETLLDKFSVKSFSKEHSSNKYVCFVYRKEDADTYDALTWK